MVRRAISVGTHRLQPLKPPDVEAVGHREADAGMILVVACTLNLHRCAVEEKAVVGIEADRTDAEAADRAIDGDVGDDDLARKTVELRRVERP